jgi:hypothetical protein
VHSPAPYTGHYAITGRVQLCDACTIPPALPTLRARAYTLRPHHLRGPPQLPSHRCNPRLPFRCRRPAALRVGARLGSRVLSSWSLAFFFASVSPSICL